MLRGFYVLLFALSLSAPAVLAQSVEPIGAETLSLPESGEIPPLLESQQKIFMAAPEDPEPEERAKDSHFYVSNENNLHLFYEHTKDRGGAYVGVGSDQAYLFIGWQRPQIAFLIDYDRYVVNTHHAHQTFLLAAKNPREYIRLWQRKNKEKAIALITERFDGDPRLPGILEAFDEARPHVLDRLAKVRNHFKKTLDKKIPTYLTHQEEYDFIRAMVRSGRMRPMLVNLLDDTGMRGVGKAARELGVPIRILYLSNAEQYWEYTDAFRENIYALHIDEQSLLLRTLGKTSTTFIYVPHPFDNWIAWLKKPAKSVWHIPRRDKEYAENVYDSRVKKWPKD